jgi:hypothetical protein
VRYLKKSVYKNRVSYMIDIIIEGQREMPSTSSILVTVAHKEEATAALRWFIGAVVGRMAVEVMINQDVSRCDVDLNRKIARQHSWRQMLREKIYYRPAIKWLIDVHTFRRKTLMDIDGTNNILARRFAYAFSSSSCCSSIGRIGEDMIVGPIDPINDIACEHQPVVKTVLLMLCEEDLREMMRRDQRHIPVAILQNLQKRLS